MNTLSKTFEEGVGKEKEIYEKRFSEREDRARTATWKILCERFFPRFIKSTDDVVDLGAGDGNFILNIVANRKVAVDLSTHVEELRRHGIEVLVTPATQFADKLVNPVDVVFMSNFLEHLPNKAILLQVLEECHRALKPTGRVIILQPNVRYAGAAYWDYIDHHIALTENSLAEALSITGFEVKNLIPRFLPYSAKSRIGRLVGNDGLNLIIRLYLALPFLWRIFGQQTFVVAEVKK